MLRPNEEISKESQYYDSNHNFGRKNFSDINNLSSVGPLFKKLFMFVNQLNRLAVCCSTQVLAGRRSLVKTRKELVLRCSFGSRLSVDKK